MPLQDIAPVFLTTLPDIPVAYAGAVLAPLAAAVAALWKTQIAAIERERERERNDAKTARDQERADAKAAQERLEALAREGWAGVRDAATSSQEVITIVKAQNATWEEIRRELGYLRRGVDSLVERRGVG